jgi:hypothetical protein
MKRIFAFFAVAMLFSTAAHADTFVWQDPAWGFTMSFPIAGLFRPRITTIPACVSRGRSAKTMPPAKWRFKKMAAFRFIQRT